jgi:adenylosuccinate synthase
MSRKWLIVTGLGFGDEGKGTTVDWLARAWGPDLVVRYSGGPQALHHVVPAPNMKGHGFRQFGSGTLAGTPTLLSGEMIVSLDRLESEAKQLGIYAEMGNLYEMMYISTHCRVLTSIHGDVVRHLEMGRHPSDRHGTTGVGIGGVNMFSADTDKEPLRIRDIGSGSFKDQMKVLRAWGRNIIGPEYQPEGELTVEEWIDQTHQDWKEILTKVTLCGPALETELLSQNRIIFEGSQGILLDQDFGFHPYTTWAHVGFTPVYELAATMNIDIQGPQHFYHLGVIRSYHTRHGAGPLVSERALDYVPNWRLERHNRTTPFMGSFRIGEFELPLWRYALRAAGSVNGTMMTHLDHAEDVQIIDQYETDGLGQLTHIPFTNMKGDLIFQRNVGKHLMKATAITTGETMMERLEIAGAAAFNMVAASWGPSSVEKDFMDSNLKSWLEL